MSDDVGVVEDGVALGELGPAPVGGFVGEGVVACFFWGCDGAAVDAGSAGK